MKKFIRNILFALLPLISIACGKDNGNEDPKNDFVLNREDIIGCWQVAQAKFDESAKMTDWPYEDTYATFEENGIYKGEGHFGNGEGTYSVAGNVITTKVDNVPYIEYEVTGMENGAAYLTATICSSGQKIWMICGKAEFLDITPEDHLSDETFFNQEGQIATYIAGIYNDLSKFAEKKVLIEEQLTSGNLSSLNANNADIKSMWTYLYSALNKINVALKALQNNGNGFVDRYIPHLKALRAFVGYNLSSLWGDVPFTTVSSPDNRIEIMESKEILKLAAEDIGESYGYSSVYGYGYSYPYFPNWYIYLNPCAAQVLLGEIKLTQGKLDEAKSHFNLGDTIKIGKEEYNSWDEIFTFIKTNTEGQTVGFILVYSKLGMDLLKQEANGTIGNLVDSWKDFSNYGYWQMLKRIGKAEEVTGCQKYQLLFPYPQQEADYWVHQNEGY